MNQKSALNKESYASCLIVGIMALLCLFPFWVAVVNSFASENSVTLSGYSIIPKELSLDGYKYLLNNKGIILLRSFGISFLIVIVGTAYTMFVTVCFAYAISQDRKDFPPAIVLSFFSWFTTVFSGGVIPWYILCTRYYGLYNNLWALFIPSALNVFNMFVIRNSFKAIPKDLIEAARIDGAGKWKQIVRVTLPQLKSTIILMTLLSVGRIFASDFGLFYQVPMDSGALYNVTQTVDTYVYRALIKNGDVGMSAAASLIQSIVGFVTVVTANWLVKKADSDSALF